MMTTMECGICDGVLEAAGKMVEVRMGKFKVRAREARCNKCNETFYIIEAKKRSEVRGDESSAK